MRILLAIDGSKDAETATAFLKQLPLPPSTALRIMVVVTLPTFPLDVPPVREFKRSALEDVQRIIDDARASLAPGGFGIDRDGDRLGSGGPIDRGLCPSPRHRPHRSCTARTDVRATR